MVSINFIINVLIQVLAIFIFLTIFFFTYASKVEGTIVQDNVNFLLDDLSGIHLGSLPDNIKTTLVNQINSIEVNTPENIKAGQEIEDSNNAIKSRTIKTAGMFTGGVVIIVVISYLLSKKGVSYFKNFNLPKIIKETIVILIAVALTEFIFLKYIGAKYISIDPNVIKKQLYQNLNNSIK